MHKVIATLRLQVSQEAERVRKRGRMVEIIEDALQGLEREGFAPTLELADGALVVLRVDGAAFALRPMVAVPPEPVATVPPAATVATGLPVAKAAADRPARGGSGISFWTVDRDAELLRMRAEGVLAAKIAAHFGVTTKAIDARVGKMKRRGVDVGVAVRPKHQPFASPATREDGVVLRAWTPEEDVRLISDYNAGVAVADLAQSFGRTRRAVTNRVTTLRQAGRIDHHRGIVPNDNKWSEDRLAELARLWKIMPVMQIAAQLGVSCGAVSGMAHRRGLGPSFPARSARAADAVAAPDLPPAAEPVALGADAPEQKSEPKSDPVAAEPVAAAPVAPPPVAPPPAQAPVSPAVSPSGFVPSKGGSIVSPGARPMAIHARPVRIMPGMTRAEREAAVRAHVDALAATDDFDAEADLELCEAAFGGSGGLALFATDFGIDSKIALHRFDEIVAILREPGKRNLPIEAAALLLPALRDRVKAARGVAA